MLIFTDKELLLKQKKAARMKEWYAKTKDIRQQKSKEYRNKNKESFNKYRNNYRTKNPAGIFDCIKQSAKKRNIALVIERKDFVVWHNEQQKVCTYCGRTEEQVNSDVLIVRTKATRLTIDRKNNDAGYELGNIVLSCIRCNSIKSNYFSFEEMVEIGSIIKRKYV